MIKFTVQGEQYNWNPINQRLTIGDVVHDVFWETGIGGMCDVRTVSINGKPCPIPQAFTSKTSSFTLRTRLVSFDVSKLKVMSLKGWRQIVNKANWSCDDIALLISCMNVISLDSKREDHRHAFGELVGLYLLTLAQTALLLQLLQDDFRSDMLQQRGGKRERETPRYPLDEERIDHLSQDDYAAPVSGIEDLTNHMAGLSINQGWTEPLIQIADTLQTQATSAIAWMTSLNFLTSSTTGHVFPIAATLGQYRRHTGSLFYVLLIAMVLQNWYSLYHFRAGEDYAFHDNRPFRQRGCDTDRDYVPITGSTSEDLFAYQPQTACEASLAGAYLHVLNLHPPVPIFGQLFAFSEEAYWQSADETSGSLQSFFVSWLGNPADNQRVRLNYASVHVGISLLFVSILCQTISRRPLGSRILGQGTSWTAGMLFILLLVERIIVNFPYWAIHRITGV